MVVDLDFGDDLEDFDFGAFDLADGDFADWDLAVVERAAPERFD